MLKFHWAPGATEKTVDIGDLQMLESSIKKSGCE